MAKCVKCDLTLATQKDYDAPGLKPAAVSKLCWSRYQPADVCLNEHVDWRARALEAEGKLRHAETRLAQLSSKRVKPVRKGEHQTGDLPLVDAGTEFLKSALKAFKMAGAPGTAHRVRLAISSARGAARAADGRRIRHERKAAGR